MLINSITASYVSYEGHRLYRLEGNCGRVIRRFLCRMLENSGNMVHQSLDDGGLTALPDSDFDAMTAYAAELQERNAPFLCSGLISRGVVSDQGFGIVCNTYEFKLNIQTATVAELKELVLDLVVLADNLQPFIAHPARELHPFLNLEPALLARKLQQEESMHRVVDFFRQQTDAAQLRSW